MPTLVLQHNESAIISAVIAADASLSAAIRLPPGHYLAAVVMPAAWTAAALTFQGSADGSLFNDLYDEGGNEQTVSAAAGRMIVLTPGDWCAVPFLKVRSGTAASAVAQAAARTLTLVARPL